MEFNVIRTSYENESIENLCSDVYNDIYYNILKKQWRNLNNSNDKTDTPTTKQS